MGGQGDGARTLDSTGDVGSYTSVAIGTDNNPVISYYGNSDLKVYGCADTACASWRHQTSYSVLPNVTTSQRTGTITIAGQTFTVTQAGVVTDATLTVGTTSIKAVHITELRTRINTVRSGCGLSTYAFTDPTLTAGSTMAKAVHLTDLRTALGQAYVACGQSAPTYTDATLATGVTVIKVVHITELRAAVLALE